MLCTVVLDDQPQQMNNFLDYVEENGHSGKILTST